MQFTNDEIETIKALIEDRGFEYGLKSNLNNVWLLAERLGMKNFCERYKQFLD